MSTEPQPLEIDILVDVSTSTVKRPIGTPYRYREVEIRGWMDRIVATSRNSISERDRLERFRFASSVSATDDRAWLSPIDRNQVEARRGRTALLDAIALILMRPPAAGLRRVVLAITDGRDTASAIEESLLLDVANRSEGSIYLIAAGGREGLQVPGISRHPIATIDGYEWLLNEISDRTGGVMVKVTPRDDPADAFNTFLERFKTRYTLTYEPEGVKRQGWHTLAVKVRGKNYDVKARRGFWRE